MNQRPRRGRTSRTLEVLLVLIVSLWPSTGFADDFEDFERARQAYEQGDYPVAVEAFQALVGGESPRLELGPIRLESRKFYAAALLFIGQREAAYEQFCQLLREDPTYTLDILAFPAEIITLFEEARETLLAEQRRVEQERLERETAEVAFREAEEARLREARDQLLDLAREETLVRPNSRTVAMLPFGAGQFQNEHSGLGITLAAVQGLALIGAGITFFSHMGLRDEEPTENTLEDARSVETTLRVGNWIANGVFVVSYLVGVIDAQLRFVTERRTTRSRELPGDLEEAIELSIHLSGARLRIRF